MGKFGGHLLRAMQRRAPPFAFVAAIMAAMSGLSGSAHAQGTVKSVHDDWQIRCDTPPGAQSRAMRADPERDGRGPAQCRPDRHRPEDRRPEEPADAGDRAARRAAAVRPRPQDRQRRRRPGRLRALPAERLRRRGRHGRQPDRQAARPARSATFIIFQTPEEGIGFPISLKGFGEGFDKLP